MIETNEILLRDGKSWLHFINPHRVIVANHLQDVLPALRDIEDLVKENAWHAAGFLSYESASAFDTAHRTHASADFPLAWFGLYSAPRLIALPEPSKPKTVLSWVPTVDQTTYDAAIHSIRGHIAQGRTYQVNYTMRLHSRFDLDPWNFFLHLAQNQNNHAAYVDTGRFVICSASPELFFELDEQTIICRPMKGTTRRGRTTREDAEQAQWLKESEKNRAENVMIVDMIRNDLGRIARTRSVHASELFTVEKFPTLWQMTSTITAKTDAPITRILGALFPCASITGAPKVSTMRIISELETTPRKIYTGSMGYIAPNRKAKFNVAIRTVLVDRESHVAEYGVGGGIVWDSTSTDEYDEALLKARVLTESLPQFSLLETMLWTPGDGFYLLEKHIVRLLDSADYFGISIASRESIETYIKKLSLEFTSPQRVRLFLDGYGNLGHEAKSHVSGNSLSAHLARKPIDSSNVFLFHKTTHREVYDSARIDFPDYDDVLLYNERGELTEFTFGNLVAEINSKLYTPPISSGLLAGTFREYLLETDQVKEKTILVSDLTRLTRVFLVNSVRKMTEVRLIR